MKQFAIIVFALLCITAANAQVKGSGVEFGFGADAGDDQGQVDAHVVDGKQKDRLPQDASIFAGHDSHDAGRRSHTGERPKAKK